jgi:inositol phosphorylceramide mannosyltransferase catalytic subunit
MTKEENNKQIDNKIILHQIWYQGKVPSKYRNIQQEWEQHYKDKKDTDYMLWNKDGIKQLLDNYPKIRTFYDNLPHMIQKIDVAKYVILYHYGGIYIDMDVKFLRHLNEVYKDKNVLICDMYCAYNFIVKITLNNFFFYFKDKRHPFLKLILDESMKFDRKFYDIKPLYILKSTGPALITKCYNLYSYPEEISIITKKHLDKYFKHESHGSWWCDENKNLQISKCFDKHDIMLVLMIVFIIIFVIKKFLFR